MKCVMGLVGYKRYIQLISLTIALVFELLILNVLTVPSYAGELARSFINDSTETKTDLHMIFDTEAGTITVAGQSGQLPTVSDPILQPLVSFSGGSVPPGASFDATFTFPRLATFGPDNWRLIKEWWWTTDDTTSSPIYIPKVIYRTFSSGPGTRTVTFSSDKDDAIATVVKHGKNLSQIVITREDTEDGTRFKIEFVTEGGATWMQIFVDPPGYGEDVLLLLEPPVATGFDMTRILISAAFLIMIGFWIMYTRSGKRLAQDRQHPG